MLEHAILMNTRFMEDKDLSTAIEKYEKTLAGRGRILVRASGTEPLIRVMPILEGRIFRIIRPILCVSVVFQYPPVLGETVFLNIRKIGIFRADIPQGGEKDIAYERPCKPFVVGRYDIPGCMIKRAIISVSDKTGIADFSRKLTDLGIEILSTGGTAKLLKQEGIPCREVSEITGFPECLDGRVKTLHPRIHAGILAIRSNPEHMKRLEELGIDTIDMIVVNLYPFKATIQKPKVEFEECVENIDIGGPSMLRAGAKNHQDITVVTDPSDYDTILRQISAAGDTNYQTRFYLAKKVFEHTAAYDALIAQYFLSRTPETELPDSYTLTFDKVSELRYGENPHQKATFYKNALPVPGSLSEAVQKNGKELSYNNISDTDATICCLKEFSEPTIVAVKHANPCGVGSAGTIFEAWQKAYEADSVSIFGGIVAANREIDAQTAEEMSKIFLEVVVAPSYTPEALEILCRKKNLRVLELPAISSPIPENELNYKRVLGGLLVQDHGSDIFKGN